MRKLFLKLATTALTLSVAVLVATASPPMSKATADSPAKSALSVASLAKQHPKGHVILPQTRKSGIPNLSIARKGIVKTNKMGKHVKVMSSPNTDATFMGALIYSDAWGETPAYSIMSMPTTGGEPSLVSMIDGLSAGWFADGKYYCYAITYYWDIYVKTVVDVYDVLTWNKLSTTELDVPLLNLLDMKQNPIDGRVYGSAFSESKVMWGTIDLFTFEFTPIVEDCAWAACGLIIKDGKGYGVTTEGDLLEITLETGATKKIGSTGLETAYITSAYYDAVSGKMLYAPNTDEASTLCSIDLATAQARLLHTYSLGEEFTGFFSSNVFNAGTPDVPTDVAINTEGSSLAYTVSFKAPVNDVQGNTLSGELRYKVFTAGQLLTGTVQPGATVSVGATAQATGMVNARVTVANDAGESYGVGVERFVGNDELGAVSVVTLTDGNDGTFLLSWLAPQPLHGGYYDESQLSYTVTDISGNVIATGLTDTSLVIDYEEPTDLCSYQYHVIAVYKGVSYEPVASNIITKGSLNPPFQCAFNSEADMTQFIIIDGNDDDLHWEYNMGSGGCASIKYNKELQMDDWMILPGLRLQAGKLYKFSIDAASSGSDFPEGFEIKMGNLPDPASMTTVVIEATQVVTKNFENYSGMFSVAADGVYYIGLHGISNPDMYYLYVDNISVTAPIDGSAPRTATNVIATASPDGAHSATISFTTPTNTISGGTLTSISKVIVTRGDSVEIGSIDNPEIGKTYSITDTKAPAGKVSYSVVVSNENGSSDAVSTSVFVGFSYPAAVTNVSVEESAECEVTLSWDAVTTDANGLTFPAGAVTYAVYTYDSNGRAKVKDGITTTTYTYTAIEAGQQAMLQYALFAESEAGEGDGTLSDMICVGTPYITPFGESFADKTLSYEWGISSPDPDQAMEASLADDSTFSGVVSQDGDNGYICFIGEYIDDAATLFSGKIAVPPTGKTNLTFYTFGISPEAGNNITASVLCEGQTTELGTLVPLAEMDWIRVSYSLDAFAGKNIQIMLSSVVKKYNMVLYDNITVGTPLNNDLVLTKFNAPAKVNAGSDIELLANIENYGLLEASGYSVDFYMNGKLLASEPGETMASGAKATVAYTLTTSPMTADELEFYAAINFAADENTLNNTSSPAKTSVVKTNYPSPQSLTAAIVDGNAELKWTACGDVVGNVDTITEDFENAQTGSHEVEGWTMVDIDGKPVGGIQGANVPGIIVGQTKSSFFVFENSGSFSSSSYNAHSGTKYLVSFFNYDQSAVSDWAISPELSGRAQTIRFWAKSYDGDYPEKIRVHYTTTKSLNPADYTMVSEFGTVTPSAYWNEFSFDVPEGCTHFAIESCATDAFFLMLDDVTYEASAGALALKGYNVYDNGSKANAELVGTNSYLTDKLADGEHVFNVTAVYDKGESRPSNDAALQYSGLESIATALNVFSVKGEIIVMGSSGARISVATTAGMIIASREGVDSSRIKVPPGVYIVSVGKHTAKVVVK